MKWHATTWDRISDMMEKVHVAYGLDTHRPVVVVFFYPNTEHPGAWSGAAIVGEQFMPLNEAQARGIQRLLMEDGTEEGMAEA